MSKTYNGNDKIDNFFAHYGRKGQAKVKEEKEATPKEKKRREILLEAERRRNSNCRG